MSSRTNIDLHEGRFELHGLVTRGDARSVHVAHIWDEATSLVGRNLPRHRRNGEWIFHAIQRGDY